MASSSSNVVGVHYRVGKKIGEGSFGVLFEGTNLLNNTQVAIKFEPRKSDAPQLRDEYDWMKLNNGKGWDLSARASQTAPHREGPDVSRVAVAGGQPGGQRGSKAQISADRLNAELPKPGQARQSQQPVSKQQPRRHHNSQDLAKRTSNGMQLDTPDAASTAPQFANSTPNLPGRLSTQAMNSRQPSGVQPQQQTRPAAQQQQQPEQKEGFMQKLLKVLCCG